MIKNCIYLLLIVSLLFAGIADAAILFDATSFVATGTGNMSWTHTPASAPRGAIVLCMQSGAATDQISTVTYGGVAMSEVAGSPHTKGTGETTVVYGFFLGSGIPTNAQTIVVTVTGAATKKCSATTVTAATDTSVDATDTDINSDSLANPSGSIATSTGVTTYIYAALSSGHDADESVLPTGGYTSTLSSGGGSMTWEWMRRTTNPTGGAVTYGWTQTAEDAVGLAIAVREAPVSTQINNLMMQGYGG